MSCPRCGRETAPTLAFCTRCGAPLALGEEPAPLPLDASVELDRRGPGRTPPPLPGPAAAAAIAAPAPRASPPPPAPSRAPPPPAAERSHWNLGPPLTAEPAAAPPDDLDVPDPEVDAVEVHLRRAPSGRRALAWAIDVAPFATAAVLIVRTLLAEAAAPLGRGALGPDGLLDLLAREAGIVAPVVALLVVALFVYATLAHALAGATLGKWIARIRVAGPDGRRPTLGRSAARSALAVVSAALLGLGLLAALFTRSGRALHDLGASTWVVEA